MELQKKEILILCIIYYIYYFVRHTSEVIADFFLKKLTTTETNFFFFNFIILTKLKDYNIFWYYTICIQTYFNIAGEHEHINISKQLANGWVYLHSWWIYITIFILTNTIVISKNNCLKKIKNIKMKSIKILVMLSCVNIFIGIAWANQELLWNFWWTWDSVELLNLICIGLFTLLHHKKKKQITKWQFVFFFILAASYAQRNGYISSIHNFVGELNDKNPQLCSLWICNGVAALLTCITKIKKLTTILLIKKIWIESIGIYIVYSATASAFVECATILLLFFLKHVIKHNHCSIGWLFLYITLYTNPNCLQQLTTTATISFTNFDSFFFSHAINKVLHCCNIILHDNILDVFFFSHNNLTIKNKNHDNLLYLIPTTAVMYVIIAHNFLKIYQYIFNPKLNISQI